MKKLSKSSKAFLKKGYSKKDAKKAESIIFGKKKKKSEQKLNKRK